MINNYFRPNSLSKALELLNKPDTIILSGGTYVSTVFSKSKTNISVVDTQDLGINKIVSDGKIISIGSTAKLEEIYKNQNILESLAIAIHLEGSINIRNSVSLGGLLVRCTGRSAVATSLLSLDAHLHIEPGSEVLSIGNFLINRHDYLTGKIITHISFNLDRLLAFEYISRTKFDQPLLMVALSKKANTSRLVVGGFGPSPLLVSDGSIADDLPLIASSAMSNSTDENASSEFRAAIAQVLTKRCLYQLMRK